MREIETNCKPVQPAQFNPLVLNEPPVDGVICLDDTDTNLLETEIYE